MREVGVPGWVYDLKTAEFLKKIERESEDLWLDYLWLRCRVDVALFCSICLPDRLEEPFSALHWHFLERAKPSWRDRSETRRLADAAPRGAAKSTIESYAQILHDVVYGIEAFIGIISTTYPLAEGLVSDLFQTLKTPELHPDLHELYGPIRIEGSRTDFVAYAEGQDAQGTRISAFSFGGSVRGEKHSGVRFTKILIDDGEHPERVRSPEQRRKTWAFLSQDILKAGRRGSVYRVIGTVLHPDSMLNRLLDDPGWQATRWKSVISWPRDMRQWDRCRRLWGDLSDPDRESTARQFYERHRAKMDDGAEVLWPEHESLYELMMLRWAEGEAAFSYEKQNEPVDPALQVFEPTRFERCRFASNWVETVDGRRIALNDLELSCWLDPRASREITRGDYAAIALVGRDEHGYFYVLRVSMARDSAARQIDRLWEIYDLVGPRCRYAYEDNGFQSLLEIPLEQARQERVRAGRSATMAVEGYTSTTNKMNRIMSLAPRIANGWIQFAEDLPPELMDQFRSIPTGSHDDGPDAVERAIWVLDGGNQAIVEMGGRW